MDEIKLSDDVIEQIKYFNPFHLTEEQESLIDKLITDEDLKERYEENGLCKKCNQIRINTDFCNYCVLQPNFKNWTSGNHIVDEFIQKAQLKAKDKYHIIEWIEYDKFEDVEYLAKGGFGTTFKAVWKDGYIDKWGYKNDQWKRGGKTNVALKCLHNSQDIAADFLKEVESNILVYNIFIVRCFGITKDPKTNNFMMVMELKNEWIEYDKFEDVEYLAKGGFGTTFKAVWKDGYIDKWGYKNDQWKRGGKTNVALKCLHNSQDIAADFLKEVESNILVYNIFIVRCFGITKDPKTNNFMMVMELKNGSLRQHLNNNFTLLNWYQKLGSLYTIAMGLQDIHNNGFIHHDFHSGNILSNFGGDAYITDLGLCQPANVKSSQNSNKEIYGVLPYVAPEVLRGKEYTQATHDEFLAMKICNGLRPKSNYRIPQLIFDIINQCWDADPLKRPNAIKLFGLIGGLWSDKKDVNSVISGQAKEADDINKNLSFSSLLISSDNSIPYTTHPQAVYTSKLLDFKNLPVPKNADNNEIEYSDSLKMDFTKLNINSKENFFGIFEQYSSSSKCNNDAKSRELEEKITKLETFQTTQERIISDDQNTICNLEGMIHKLKSKVTDRERVTTEYKEMITKLENRIRELGVDVTIKD
ncbi:kinase-like protein [Rhizophagus irregularis]|uniref:Kinase-like protein n=1 Tax=Rhizophagus irregularis TaxID=588596 RepID=A0A2N0PM91_9GLOM|nr:kinase-like protein [Rhizophagus irregularis]